MVRFLKVNEFVCKKAERDGVIFSTENTFKRYGYTWKSTARGVVSVLTDEKGHQIFISKETLIKMKLRNL